MIGKDKEILASCRRRNSACRGGGVGAYFAPGMRQRIPSGKRFEAGEEGSARTAAG